MPKPKQRLKPVDGVVKWWQGNRDADWKGKLHRRFVLLHWRHEWGRWCYQTNCYGETTKCWWERDLKVEAEEERRLRTRASTYRL